MLLRCERLIDEEHSRSAARWLRDYHLGLALGLTGGLIVEGFRLVPGHEQGMVQGSNRGGYDLLAGMGRITGRASHWGIKLARLTPTELQPLGVVSRDLKTMIFQGGKRRYIMLINASTERYIRGTADLPSVIDDLATKRAVQVSPNSDTISGRVVQPSTRRLSLPFDLAPGDAELWELFIGDDRN